MRKVLVAIAVTATALAGSGCVSANGHQDRAVGSAEVAHYAVGNTANSIEEVAEALKDQSIRANVHSHLGELLWKSEDFNTSFEFERDLFVCEQLHPIPADHEADHPESKSLADCVMLAFETHQVGHS